MTIRRPAWQSDWTAVGDNAETYSSLSASLRAAVAETDPSLPVEETTYLGRPAWHGVFTVRERWGMDGELPMVFRWDARPWTRRQAFSSRRPARSRRTASRLPWDQDLRVTSLELDPALDRDWQRPAASGGKTTIVDDGTRFGTPEEVAQLSWPTLPLIPQWAPAGSPAHGRRQRRNGRRPSRAAEPQTVVVRAREGTAGQSDGARAVPPRLRLLRRPDQPQDSSGRPSAASRTSILSAGYLKGKPAVFGDDASDGTQIGISAPTLITYSDRSKVVITGDLTRDELVKVAESMKVYGDVDRPLMPGFGQ